MRFCGPIAQIQTRWRCHLDNNFCCLKTKLLFLSIRLFSFQFVINDRQAIEKHEASKNKHWASAAGRGRNVRWYKNINYSNRLRWKWLEKKASQPVTYIFSIETSFFFLLAARGRCLLEMLPTRLESSIEWRGVEVWELIKYEEVCA